MNVVKLMGGLGNQLFQYAFGQAQRANGIEVCYDRTWFDDTPSSNTIRPYRLDKFDTDIKFCPFLKQQSIHETVFDPALLLVTNCNFFGYWQYPEYFTSILTAISQQIRVKQIHYSTEYRSLKKHLSNGQETISVHIRRGDYLTTPGFSVLPLRYYFEALQNMKGDLMIFSDDLTWCRANFRQEYFNRNIIFADVEDFLAFDLMRQCTHNIVANSSFSLFAAVLNPNEDKMVVIPKQWQKSHPDRPFTDKSMFLPKEWIAV